MSPEQLLGQIEGHSDKRVVVADMEAGAGTLTRMPPGALDFALLVVEPSAKSIDVARRASAIIAERQIGLALVIANRMRDPQDLELVRAGFPSFEIFAIPDDPTLSQADRDAQSPMDVNPASPAVQAIGELAARLNRRTVAAPAADLPVLQ